ncbi:MAG TPA: hypothetical protein VGK89_06700 [Candidatus Eisenbacteria bacterium]|jgi:hypothetical protein
MLVIFAQGCASQYVGHEGPARPRSQIAVVRIDPSSERLKFGSVDGVALPKSVHQVRVLPGIHTIALRGFSEQGAPLGLTLIPAQVESLSVDVQAGHFYVVKAAGTNFGQARFTPWIEDRATGRVVAGKKGYGARY